MALKALGAVDDGAACLFQTLGPLDVVLFVEAGAELHEHRDLFAVLGGIDQRLAQAALLGHAVERDSQRDALGVVEMCIRDSRMGRCLLTALVISKYHPQFHLAPERSAKCDERYIAYRCV